MESSTRRGRPPHDHGLSKWHGPALRARRVLAKMTVAELATRVGVSKSTITRWEASTPNDPSGEGYNPPTTDSVTLLARALKCPRTAFSRQPKL